MKILSKPSTAPKNQKLKNSSNRKQPPTFLDVSEKYLKYKKSASLPNKLTQKDKLGRIMRIYNALAHNDAQIISKSISKSKSKNSLRSYMQRSIRGSSFGSNGKNLQLNNASRNFPTKSTSPFARNQYLSTQMAKEANSGGIHNGALHLNTQFSKNLGNINNTNTKRLSLNQGNSKQKNLQSIFSSISSLPINSSHLVTLIEKLEEIMKCKLNRLFTSSFELFSESMRKHLTKYKGQKNNSKNCTDNTKTSDNNAFKHAYTESIRINNQNIIPCFFKLLEDCFQRFYEIKFLQKKRALQESKSQVSAELNKYKIKLTILNKKLEQNQRKIEQAESIIRRQEQRKINLVTVGFNTEAFKIPIQLSKKSKQKTLNFQNSEQTVKLNAQEQKQGALTNVQLLKKIRQFEKRQKQLFSVLCVLHRQGVDIEKAYESAIIGMNAKKKQNKTQKQNQEYEQEFGSQNDDESQSFVVANLFKPGNMQKKPKKKINYDHDSQNEADQSIISSIDALSFNYEGKQAQADIFSSRVSYIPAAYLNMELQNRLKLDFQLLQEEVGDGGFATV